MRGASAILALLCICSPIDFIPVVGWGDDVVAGITGLFALMGKKK